MMIGAALFYHLQLLAELLMSFWHDVLKSAQEFP
uniref:Uncharacterized protein n=1 Tax=Arundo donax TaxID=35708 RepID=A0A0A9C1G4_ARUDO